METDFKPVKICGSKPPRASKNNLLLYSGMVITTDFESVIPGSNPGRAAKLPI